MSIISEDVLSFQMNMPLAEQKEIIDSVLQENVQYTKVKVVAYFIFDSFGLQYLKNREQNERFWYTLGKTITTLEVDDFCTIDVWIKYFPNIQTFHCNNSLDSDPITRYFVQQHLSDVEVIILNNDMIEDEFVDDRLVTILENRTAALKKIITECEISFEMEVINEIFGSINFNILQMDEIIFECHSIPASVDYEYYEWVILKLEMIFNERRLHVKPLNVCTVKVGQNICEENCHTKHLVIASKSVMEYSFVGLYNNDCFGYFKSCFKSFPYIQKLTAVRECNQEILDLLSEELRHLIDTEIAFQSNVKTWPAFPNLRSINVSFKESSKEDFSTFLKSYPHLRSITVHIGTGISANDCVKIIANNLIHLDFMNISCDESQVTKVGLNTIKSEKIFKGLRYLHIICSENRSEVTKLFKVLPLLNTIDIKSRKYFKYSSRSPTKANNETFITIYSLPIKLRMHILSYLQETDQSNFLQALEVHINDLPDEILDKIFSYFNLRYKPIRFRQVCKRWFDILSSSTTCNRVLNLTNSFLSWNSSPINLFINTKFKYNELIFNHATIYIKNESLFDFWKTIGRDITSIRMFCAAAYTTNIFDSGFDVNHLPSLTTLYLQNLTYYHKLPLEKTPSWISILSTIKILCISFYFGLLVLDNEINDFQFTNLEEIRVYQYHEALTRKWEVILEFLKLGNFPNLKRLVIFMGVEDTFSLLFKTSLNFDNITVLSVVRKERWSDDDLELILKHCPHLQIMGFGVFMPNGHTDCDKIFEMQTCVSVVNILFEKLTLLTDIGFCYANNQKTKRKVYKRIGIRSFKESQEPFYMFDMWKKQPC